MGVEISNWEKRMNESTEYDIDRPQISIHYSPFVWCIVQCSFILFHANSYAFLMHFSFLIRNHFISFVHASYRRFCIPNYRFAYAYVLCLVWVCVCMSFIFKIILQNIPIHFPYQMLISSCFCFLFYLFYFQIIWLEVFHVKLNQVNCWNHQKKGYSKNK